MMDAKTASAGLCAKIGEGLETDPRLDVLVGTKGRFRPPSRTPSMKCIMDRSPPAARKRGRSVSAMPPSPLQNTARPGSPAA
jgi:hypothetical protein